LAEGDEPRVVAEFVDYPGMLAALRARVNELQINGERFDEFAGLPRGYLSKLIGTRPIRRVGMTSLSLLMNALLALSVCRGSRRNGSAQKSPKAAKSEFRSCDASSSWLSFYSANVETYSAARRHDAHGEADARTAQRAR
jgi:hypothetical protein